jgi:tight adherence protein C
VVSYLPIDAMALLVGVFAITVIAAIVLSLRYLLKSRVDTVQERIRRYVVDADASLPPTALVEENAKQSKQLINKALKPFAMIATPKDEEELGRLRTRLGHAGFRGERAMVVFLSVKILLALFLCSIVIWINASRSQSLPFIWVLIVFAMSFGFYLPNIWLQKRINSRQKEINRSFPDALDLLVTCVDSGLGLDASMNRLAEEIALSAPLLSQEFMQASLEIRAGSTRGEAFRRLAERTGVEEIRNLSSIIVQTEIFGTSIAKALRIMAEGMRIRRAQKAEEKAAAVGVKMTVPLILCILPSLMAVLLGPAVVNIVRTVFSSTSGSK